ncbi:MAG: hypothetical protein ACRDHZ_17055, partial [Ktedonobacteraceae bacterium]
LVLSAGRRRFWSRPPNLIFLLTLLSTGLLVSCSRASESSTLHWNRRAAARYLDQREARWATWPGAARDHGTFCVSCHTTLSYALARPEIQATDNDKAGAAEEASLIADVRERVRLWRQAGPYYTGRQEESRGTESVLNALILATHDARNGRFSVDTRSAFEHMWALQKTSGEQRGAWAWLQFRQEPWEAPDSVYYGACLAALATGSAPEAYRDSASVQPNLMLLREYLNRNYSAETPINHVTLLWASLKWHGLINAEMQQSIISEIYEKQRPDGGWSLATLIGEWKRTDGTPLVLESDGYATGLISYVLQLAGVPHDDIHLRRGLMWLSRNQSWWNGHWPAYSLNKRRHDPFSNASQFMNDAATAYAAMALAKADSVEPRAISGGTAVRGALGFASRSQPR